jgi:hypothetical protein
LDPAAEGINFIISNSLDVASPTTAPNIDPNTGLPIPPPAIEPIDIHSTIVRLPSLRNLRLKDLLDAICKVAEQPIKYTIEHYGVIFSRNPLDQANTMVKEAFRTSDSQVPQVRTFRIDRETLVAGLESAFGISLSDRPLKEDFEAQKLGVKLRQAQKELDQISNKLKVGADSTEEYGKAQTEKELLEVQLKELQTLANKSGVDRTQQERARDIQDSLKRVFSQLGINMSAMNKALVYNELTGILLVRATLADLKIAEAAIETLGGAGIDQSRPGVSGSTGLLKSDASIDQFHGTTQSQAAGGLQAELERKEAQLKLLSETLRPEHPKIRELTREIEELKENPGTAK